MPFASYVSAQSAKVGDHLDQDALDAGSSHPSSTEKSTGIISFVVTLPFRFFSARTSCWPLRPIGFLRLTGHHCSRYVLLRQGGHYPQRTTSNYDGWAGEHMRSAEVTDIALAAFAIVLISALLIAFVSLH